jgi:hypothetical protein
MTKDWLQVEALMPARDFCLEAKVSRENLSFA